MKTKICLVCDIPNWAFDMIAKKVKKNLDEKYDIRIDYYDVRENPDEFYEFLEKNDDCDLIHFFWRKALIQMETEAFKNKVLASGRNVEEYIKEKSKKISTSVYDFFFLDENGINAYKNVFNIYANSYYVSSKRLYAEYENVAEFKKPEMVVHDICDKELFPPINTDRFEYDNIKDRKILIGWVGNSGHDGDTGLDLKGFKTILKPAVNELIAEGYNIEGHYADRNEKWRTVEEMPQYYSEIDVCVCTSLHEGTPRPALEAMYSGIPIISTDVGIVSEALGEKQKAFVIGDRANGKNDEIIKKNLKERIIYLYNNRHMFKELSDENIESIEKFDGGKTIQAFEKFFEIALNK